MFIHIKLKYSFNLLRMSSRHSWVTSAAFKIETHFTLQTKNLFRLNLIQLFPFNREMIHRQKLNLFTTDNNNT